jgi:hypothetical protein
MSLIGRSTSFVIGDEHTIFEWCMIYTDRHPGGVHPNHNSATVERMRMRLILLGACGQSDEVTRISNAVYRELAAGIKADRIHPRKRVYLDDRPAELDFTLCVIGVNHVLDVAQRRQDGGRRIAELLAAHAGKITSAGSIPTGAQGRPSKGKDLIQDEFDRRNAAGEVLNSLASEAQALLVWYKTEFPGSPRPTIKTIKNNIRAGHRRSIARQRQTDA